MAPLIKYQYAVKKNYLFNIKIEKTGSKAMRFG